MNFNTYTEVDIECFDKFDNLQVKGLLTDECQGTYETPYFPPEFTVVQVKYGHVDITGIVDVTDIENECLNKLFDN